MHLYLARHGQTEWNVQGRRQGQLDSPLTRTGEEQAQHLARLLSDQGIDAIFASPLGRAAATADILGTALGHPVSTLDDLAEVHHGDFAGLSTDEVRASYPGALEERAADRYHWRFPGGGESYADADERAARALRRVQKGSNEKPLIVSHEMIGRVLLRQLLDLTPAEALAYNHPHEVVYVVDPVLRALRSLPMTYL